MLQARLQKFFNVKEILDIDMIQLLHFKKERADIWWHEVNTQHLGARVVGKRLASWCVLFFLSHNSTMACIRIQ